MIPQDSYYEHTHFLDVKTEAQRSELIHPRSYGLPFLGTALLPGHSQEQERGLNLAAYQPEQSFQPGHLACLPTVLAARPACTGAGILPFPRG